MRFRPSTRRHVNVEIVREQAELFASTKIRRYARAVEDVLTRQAGDVGTRSTYVLALDHSNALPLSRKCPGGDRRSGTAAEDYQVVVLQAPVDLHVDIRMQPTGHRSRGLGGP